MAETILIIEDNEKNRLLLKDILSYHGYTVLEAEDSKVGVDMALAHQPSLILMDIQMPTMDGISALKAIRGHTELKQPVVVAITSFAMAGDREKLIEDGFDEYISKPIDTRKLPVLVRGLLDKGRA